MGNSKLVTSRAVVERNYALLPPEGWVVSVLPGWRDTEAHILTAPAMGARFSQYMLNVANGGGTSTELPAEVECFFFVLDGLMELVVDGKAVKMSPGEFAYLAPGEHLELRNLSPHVTRVLWIKKRYEPLPGLAAPRTIVGHEGRIRAENYMGREKLLMKHLLPDGLAFDMAVNIFTFQPGGMIPMVETHIMEHGLYMLEGQGVYLLDQRWMEVQQGDFIWMGPYCPQAFYAGGDTASRYIYYKNVNRDVEL